MMQLNMRLTAQSGHAHDLVEALNARMRDTRRQSGCSGAHVAADVLEANAFWYSEDWHDLKALERELRSDRFSQLLALVETSAQTPVFEFRDVTAIRGLDYLAAVREAGGLTHESPPLSPGALPSTDLTRPTAEPSSRRNE